MIPKATNTSQNMTSPPLMGVGEHSAVHTATVAELAPILRPKTRRDPMKDCHDVLTACQDEAPMETRHQRKMVPRRPR